VGAGVVVDCGVAVGVGVAVGTSEGSIDGVTVGSVEGGTVGNIDELAVGVADGPWTGTFVPPVQAAGTRAAAKAQPHRRRPISLFIKTGR